MRSPNMLRALMTSRVIEMAMQAQPISQPEPTFKKTLKQYSSVEPTPNPTLSRQQRRLLERQQFKKGYHR